MERQMQAPTGYVSSQDGTQIAFDRVGTGPAIILVGGATQHRWVDPTTAKLADLLASDFSVYHYDRRGRGDSGSSDVAKYAVAREIEDIAALIDHAGGKAHLFGMSSGAVLALNAAAAGLPVQRLALYEPPFTAQPGSEIAQQEGWVQRLKQMHTAGQHGDMMTYFMVDIVGMPAEVAAPMRSEPSWSMYEAVAPTLIYDTTLLLETQRDRPLIADQWADVTVPTLVIDGGDSPDFMRDAVQLAVDALPNARRKSLPGQTHAYDPEVLAPVLRSFFCD